MRYQRFPPPRAHSQMRGHEGFFNCMIIIKVSHLFIYIYAIWSQIIDALFLHWQPQAPVGSLTHHTLCRHPPTLHDSQ